MKGFKSKKGISLIVLVITISVMIILAAAIILSISNSGIIDKANKAKQDSDTANLKEYVNILEAEWEMMTTEERGNITKTEYINNGLNAKGYTRRLNEDGILLAENTVKVLDKGLKIGDTVKGYNEYLTEKTKNFSELTGISWGNELKTETDFEWKYIGISDEGKLEIVPDYSTVSFYEAGQLALYGEDCFLNGVTILNTVCDELYSSKIGKARSINIDDINKILGYTGEKGSYEYLKYEPTKEPLTIGEIEKIVGLKVLYNTEVTINGKDYTSLKVDYYEIDKTDDVGDITYLDRLNLVYTGSFPSDYRYWLASPCIHVQFGDKELQPCYRTVSSSEVGCLWVWFGGTSASIRPVVEINPDVSVSYSNGTLTLN